MSPPLLTSHYALLFTYLPLRFTLYLPPTTLDCPNASCEATLRPFSRLVTVVGGNRESSSFQLCDAPSVRRGIFRSGRGDDRGTWGYDNALESVGTLHFRRENLGIILLGHVGELESRIHVTRAPPSFVQKKGEGLVVYSLSQQQADCACNNHPAPIKEV